LEIPSRLSGLRQICCRISLMTPCVIRDLLYPKPSAW
jgi:hypothetical protein